MRASRPWRSIGGASWARCAARLPSGAAPAAAASAVTVRQLTARLSRAQSVADALAVVRLHARGADDILLAAMWTKLRALTERWSTLRRAELLGAHAPLVDMLAERTLARVDQLPPRALAAIAFSAARLSRPLCPRLLEPMAPVVVERLPSFSPQGLASVLWAYAQPLQPARADADAEAMPGPLEGADTAREADGERADGCEAEGAPAAAAPYAYTVFEAASATILDAGPERARARAPPLSAWPARDLADVARAFALARAPIERPLAALIGDEAAVRLRSRTLGAREAAGLAWAFARARTPHDQFHCALASGAAALLAECRVEELAMMAWAMAAWPRAEQQRACALAHARALGSPAWRERHEPADVREALGGEIARRCAERALSPRQLAMSLWAAATLRVSAAAPFFEGARAAAESARELTPRQVSNVAWALARGPAGCARPLLVALERELTAARLAHFTPRELSTLAWAVCVADGPDVAPQLMRRLVQLVNALPLLALSGADRSALLQAGLSLRLDAPHLRLRVRADLLPPPAASMGPRAQPHEADASVAHADGATLDASAERAGAIATARAQRNRQPQAARAAPPAAARPLRSAMHAQLSAALHSLGVPHVNGLVVPGMGYTVDVALSHARVAIEIAGPQHQYVHASRATDAHRWEAAISLNGVPACAPAEGARARVDGDAPRLQRAALLKWQHLERAGWAVIVLPYQHVRTLLPRAPHSREAGGARGQAPQPAVPEAGGRAHEATQLSPLARHLRMRLSATLAAAHRADGDEGAWAVGALDAAAAAPPPRAAAPPLFAAHTR